LVAKSLSERGGDFLISTADALIPPKEAGLFAREISSRGTPAGLALTAYVDDEKPLWADLSDGGFISALGDGARQRRLVTTGLYYLTQAMGKRLPGSSAHASLRNYWVSLVTTGLPVAGMVLGKTLDVDRPEDLQQAEKFLREASPW
jgi:hypothetical protein